MSNKRKPQKKKRGTKGRVIHKPMDSICVFSGTTMMHPEAAGENRKDKNMYKRLLDNKNTWSILLFNFIKKPGNDHYETDIISFLIDDHCTYIDMTDAIYRESDMTDFDYEEVGIEVLSAGYVAVPTSKYEFKDSSKKRWEQEFIDRGMMDVDKVKEAIKMKEDKIKSRPPQLAEVICAECGHESYQILNDVTAECDKCKSSMTSIIFKGDAISKDNKE